MKRSNPNLDGSFDKDVKIAKLETQAAEVQSEEQQVNQHKMLMALSVSSSCVQPVTKLSTLFHQPNFNKRKLLFIRHGEYDMASGSLTEMGRAKINRVGELLSKWYPSVSAIYHSCTRRSKESAGIIIEKYPGVRMCPSNLLNEFRVDKNYQLKVSSHTCQPQRCT